MTEPTIDELFSELNKSLSIKNDDGHVALQVALIATVYFPDPYKREVREGVLACCEEYFRRTEGNLRWALYKGKRRMDPFGPGALPTWLPNLDERKGFSIVCHSGETQEDAGAFSIHAFGPERLPFLQYGYLQIAYPLGFGAGAGYAALFDSLLYVCRTLTPASGYGGIGILESPYTLTSEPYEPVVYQWAQRLPGLEADYPISHSIWLAECRNGGEGIKGGNWLTTLHDRFVEELGGKDKVESDLVALDPGFAVHRYDGGMVIQAGAHPELGDAVKGIWPTRYVKLAKYLRPLRVTEHNAFQHHRAGEERFDKARSEAWLRRFDDR